MRMKKFKLHLILLLIGVLATVIFLGRDKISGFGKTPVKEVEGCFIGVFREGAPRNMKLIQRFEKEAGKKVAMIMWYLDFNSEFPTEQLNKVREHGATPHITWEPWYWSDRERIHLDNIINGEYDHYIRSWAKAAKAWGHTLFIRWGHEFNIQGYPWGIINNDKDPQKYIKAYRHVVDIFKKEGAGKVKWIWCFMNHSYPEEDWNDYVKAYPGDPYVDWIGIDGYNWGTTQPWSDWQSFPYLFRDQMRRMRKLHPSKPIMIAEFASAEKGGDKASWIKAILPNLKISMRDVKAVIWFDYRKETDWRIKSTKKSLASFKEIMKDPYFLTSGEDLASLAVTKKPFERKIAKAKKAPTKLKVDGKLTEWGKAIPIIMEGRGFLKEGESWEGAQDLSGKIYLMWDEKNLYVAAEVKDNYPLMNKQKRGNIWNGDCVEMVMSTHPGADPERERVTSRDYQIGFSPGNGRDNKPSMWNWTKKRSIRNAEIVALKTKDPQGYIMEARIPWEKNFRKFKPEAGLEVGFDIALDDADEREEREAQLIWNGDYLFYKDPSIWGWLTFIE